MNPSRGLPIKEEKHDLFIHLSKYYTKLLKKFQMDNCK